MKLLIRTDVTPQLGMGHLMRTLALAEEWITQGGEVVLAFANITEAGLRRAREIGAETVRLDGEPGGEEDATKTAGAAERLGAAWVVADGYHFGDRYQAVIKGAGHRLMVIDDFGHAGRYCADLVLNANIYADESYYVNRYPDTRLLLGPRYALLRREFRRWLGWQRNIPDVAKKILVTLGGSDPHNVTERIIEAVRLIADIPVEVVVVVGGSNPHAARLKEAASGSAIRLVYDVANMAEWMAWADVAVSGGGTTALELAFMGLPSLLVELSDNQKAVAAALERVGAVKDLGWHVDLTPDRIVQALVGLLQDPQERRQMTQRGRRLVDGKGAERVVGILLGHRILLRKVEEGDCRLLWEWANDPVVRQNSLSTDPIPWDDHVRWFRAKKGDPQVLMYVAELKPGLPIGQVRFDVQGAEAVVSVSIDGRYRGQGLGGRVIAEAAEDMLQKGVETLLAYIKPGNKASVQAFTKAGFHVMGTKIVDHQPVIQMVRRVAGTGRDGDDDGN